MKPREFVSVLDHETNLVQECATCYDVRCIQSFCQNEPKLNGNGRGNAKFIIETSNVSPCILGYIHLSNYHRLK